MKYVAIFIFSIILGFFLGRYSASTELSEKMTLSKFIELNKWFYRESKHYMLGDLAVYAPWSFKFKKRFNYLKRYPCAWVKFMWYYHNE